MVYKGHENKALFIQDYEISREINGEPAAVITLLYWGKIPCCVLCRPHIPYVYYGARIIPAFSGNGIQVV